MNPTTMADKQTNTRRVPDFLLSWDRLGFRLLVFASLALAWTLQGLLAGQPWQRLVVNEVGGLMPWAFLTPMVLALDRRIQGKRFGVWGFLGAHLLGRVRDRVRRSDRGELDERIQAMLEMHERRQSVRPHLVVRERDGYVLVRTSDIHCLEATGNYVRIQCERASHLLRSTLTAVEAKLDPHRFLRIHRSWIVNLDQVREAQPWTKGGWILLTRSGLKIPVGQQYHHVLTKLLK